MLQTLAYLRIGGFRGGILAMPPPSLHCRFILAGRLVFSKPKRQHFVSYAGMDFICQTSLVDTGSLVECSSVF